MTYIPSVEIRNWESRSKTSDCIYLTGRVFALSDTQKQHEIVCNIYGYIDLLNKGRHEGKYLASYAKKPSIDTDCIEYACKIVLTIKEGKEWLNKNNHPDWGWSIKL